MKAIFKTDEVCVLKEYLANGGILIEISNYVGEPAKILKCNTANGTFEAIGVLDEEISLKLFELYPDPTPMGYHLIGLKIFIDNFC